MKPSLFIGSSSEQLETAYAIQRNLERACDATVWDQGVFDLSSNTLDDLIKQLDETDFAVFVFAPDDLTTIRSNEYATTRDNVVFELGLFIGKLGKLRTFFVMPRGRGDFRLPSDLVGVTAAMYDAARDNRQAALGPACFEISKAIEALGVRPERLPQPDIERVAVTSVLCLATADYEEKGVQEDIEILETAFPGVVEARRSLGLAEFQMELIGKKPDILHILIDIDEDNGNMRFPSAAAPQLLRPEGFAKLIEVCRPRLVVLATCDALYTASRLAALTNVVAAQGDIMVDTIVAWQRSFYAGLAAGQPLSSAFELARAVNNAPVVLHLAKDFALAPAGS